MNEFGNETDPESPNAVRWCLMGAIDRCYPNLSPKIYERCCDIVGTDRIDNWNDEEAKHTDVLKVAKQLDEYAATLAH